MDVAAALKELREGNRRFVTGTATSCALDAEERADPEE